LSRPSQNQAGTGHPMFIARATRQNYPTQAKEACVGTLGVTAPSVPVEPCVWSAKLGHDRFYCTGAQLLSGLNSVIAFASVAVSFPRSLSYTTPFWLMRKVVMPVSRSEEHTSEL